MKKLLTLGALLPLLALALAVIAPPPEAAAANKNKDKKESSSVYSYTAQEGDTYSQIARKAVQTYGIRENVKLTPAEIIFTETNLTQQAGSPVLEVGQKVTLEKSSIKEWVQKAEKLTDEEQAAWQVYVPYVDFNTNAVGQAPKTN
ncbi:hypothetical protein KC939_01760 [Candidatus Saccharibacteria bacterium]|nr:hypothetical protein [Candidatus Saccharibacteria bacterium]